MRAHEPVDSGTRPPEGWRAGKVGNFLTLHRGFDIVQADATDGSVPVVSSSGVSYYHNTSMVAPPGVVTGRKGKIGDAFFIGVPFWPHDTSLWVSDFKGNDARFVYYFLLGLRLERLDAASAVPTLNRNNVHALDTIFPPTKAEQEAIAEALSDADALIESLEQLIAKKRLIKQGAMQELLTGKRRLPGFEGKPGVHQTDAGPLPLDWEARPFSRSASITAGQVNPRVEPFRSMVLVAPNHVEPGTGRLLERVTAADQGAISGKYLFKDGHVVYSKIRPYLMKAVLADFDGLCSADMYPLVPADDVDPRFLLASLLGERFTRFAEEVSMRTGIPKINREELAKFVFALPGLKEQQAIATILSDMDTELAALDAKLEKARQIKQGMMHNLLTGKIRLV